MPRTTLAAPDVEHSRPPTTISRVVWRDLVAKLPIDNGDLVEIVCGDGRPDDGGSWWALIDAHDGVFDEPQRLLILHYRSEFVRVLDANARFATREPLRALNAIDGDAQVTLPRLSAMVEMREAIPATLLDLPITAYGTPREEHGPAAEDIHRITFDLAQFGCIDSYDPDLLECDFGEAHATDEAPYFSDAFPPDRPPADIEICEAPCGAGKTFASVDRIRLAMQDDAASRWVIVTPRISLCRQFVEQCGFPRTDVQLYTDTLMSGRERVLVTTINSLPKYMTGPWGKAEFALLDETETIFETIVGSPTLARNRTRVIASILALVGRSRLSLFLDRDVRLGTRMLVALCALEVQRLAAVDDPRNLRRAMGLVSPLRVHHYRFNKPRALIYATLSHEHMLQRILLHVDDNLRVIVYETSKHHAETLERWLTAARPGKVVLCITSETDKETRDALSADADVFLASRRVDVLVHTSTMGVGISIQTAYFHALYSVPRHHVDLRTTLQGQERARRPISVSDGMNMRVHYVVEIGTSDSKRSELNTRLVDVFRIEELRMLSERRRFEDYQQAAVFDLDTLRLEHTPVLFALATGMHYHRMVAASIYGSEFRREVTRSGASIVPLPNGPSADESKELRKSYSSVSTTARKRRVEQMARNDADTVIEARRKKRRQLVIAYRDEQEANEASRCGPLMDFISKPSFHGNMRHWQAYSDLMRQASGADAVANDAILIADTEESRPHRGAETGYVTRVNVLIHLQRLLGIGNVNLLTTDKVARVDVPEPDRLVARVRELVTADLVKVPSLRNVQPLLTKLNTKDASSTDALKAAAYYANAVMGVSVMRAYKEDCAFKLVGPTRRRLHLAWCLPRWVTKTVHKRGLDDTLPAGPLPSFQ